MIIGCSIHYSRDYPIVRCQEESKREEVEEERMVEEEDDLPLFLERRVELFP